MLRLIRNVSGWKAAYTRTIPAAIPTASANFFMETISFRCIYNIMAAKRSDRMPFPDRGMQRMHGLDSLRPQKLLGLLLRLFPVRMESRKQFPPLFGHADDLVPRCLAFGSPEDRKSTRLNSSHQKISYAVF